LGLVLVFFKPTRTTESQSPQIDSARAFRKDGKDRLLFIETPSFPVSAESGGDSPEKSQALTAFSKKYFPYTNNILFRPWPNFFYHKTLTKKNRISNKKETKRIKSTILENIESVISKD
jgi:hypothetical protein